MLDRLGPTPFGHLKDPVHRTNPVAEKLSRAYIRCRQFPNPRFDQHPEMAQRSALWQYRELAAPHHAAITGRTLRVTGASNSTAYKYAIAMEGRAAGKTVLFKGTADLGSKDGGVYDWIGRATEKEFVGFYTNAYYTGVFTLTRTK